jgi:hypothetical protein
VRPRLVLIDRIDTMPAASPSPSPANDWIHCSFDLDGRHIDAAVRRFDEDERQRVAAEVAWFAESVLTGASAETPAWKEFLQWVMSSHVALTMNEEGLDPADQFWHRLFCRAFEMVLVANGLDPMITALLAAPFRREGHLS